MIQPLIIQNCISMSKIVYQVVLHFTEQILFKVDLLHGYHIKNLLPPLITLYDVDVLHSLILSCGLTHLSILISINFIIQKIHLFYLH